MNFYDCNAIVNGQTPDVRTLNASTLKLNVNVSVAVGQLTKVSLQIVISFVMIK